MTPLALAAGLIVTALAVPVGTGQREPARPYQLEWASTDVSCPRVDVTADAPTPAPMPKRDRSQPAVGGDALDTPGLAVPNGYDDLPSTISASSWVVADLDSGEVLGACGPHEYGAPASLQKLLLAATVLPKLDPTTEVTITREDLNFEPGSSAVGLTLGGTYTVETIWLGLMLNSGNDAANTLARLGGGERGVAGTIEDMNTEARHLGANDTHAATPSGLDGPGQFTSAYDLALIFRSCFTHENFRRYTGSKTAQMPPEPPKEPDGYQIQNDNELLFNYPGAIGGKTGFTDIARHTYVGAAERSGRRLVVTMLGGEHEPVRLWQQGAALLDWGFAVPEGHSVGRLVAPGETEKSLAAANATAAPTPKPTPSLVRHTSAPAQDTRTTALIAMVAAVVVFVGIWLGMARAFRRRAARHRAPRGS